MIEVTGNLWTYPADARIITTNGTVKKNGECVMGRGCAAEAKQRWPHLAKYLGSALKEYSNVPFIFFMLNAGVSNPIVTFPVKHNWHETAAPKLIVQSATIINEMPSLMALKTIVMPRLGCGNGNLRWADVQPLLAPILDDRFHVITW